MIDERCINIDAENEGAIDPPLVPCLCPQNLGIVPLDAGTPARVVTFTVRVQNLCPNKRFIVVVSVLSGTTVVGQQCRIVSRTGEVCGNLDVPFTVAIEIPLCANTNVTVQAFGNYVNCCGSLA
ncbi:MAG: hypothetical protein E6344_13185 [Clostridium sp.]|nr:hypothetical protein [Clostridium sp.]MDU7084648.1 hypothetical protein [Clostridium sp.]